MTDEMTVQQRRSPIVPLALIGTGAAAGALTPVAIRPKYSSFDDLIKESEDKFEKVGENIKDKQKGNYQTLKDVRKEYSEEMEKIYANTDNAKWAEGVEAEGKAYEQAMKTCDDKFKKFFNEVRDTMKNSGIEGVIEKADAEKLEVEQLDAKVSEYIKSGKIKEHGTLKDMYQELEGAQKEFNKAKEALMTKNNGSVEKTLTKNGKKAVEVMKNDLSKEASEALGKFKTPNRWLNAAIGAAVVALGWLLFRPKAKEDSI